MTTRRRFWHVAGAGAAFQAGSAAVDSATIMSALVFQLTGSPLATGAVTTILRLGWLLPQLIVGYLAGRSGRAMPFYILGALGRAAAIAALALWLWVGTSAGRPPGVLGAGTLAFWALYAGLSGIVGVPYNDIVARAVPSKQRSRVLALRFFGGGILALGVAGLADRLLRSLDFPLSYAAVLAGASALMILSSVIFMAMGEPPRGAPAAAPVRFAVYLREGADTFGTDTHFRRFVIAQWCGGAVMIALPFYVVAAKDLGVGLETVAVLLGAQTAGALVANPLWGWWGDRRGKIALMRGVAALRIVPPALVLALLAQSEGTRMAFPALLAAFAVLGALSNGQTIAVLGLLMEISPENRRLAYSGYFNALTAPAYLTPLLGGVLYGAGGAASVFVVSLLAATGQTVLLRRMGEGSPNDGTR